MAWNDLNNNRTVSWNNLTGSPFSLKNGGALPNSQECLTRAEANTLNIVPITNDSRLVKKSELLLGVLACGTQFQEDSSSNYYFREIELGTTSGVVNIDYDIVFTNGASVITIIVAYESSRTPVLNEQYRESSGHIVGSVPYTFNYNTSSKITIRIYKNNPENT